MTGVPSNADGRSIYSLRRTRVGRRPETTAVRIRNLYDQTMRIVFTSCLLLLTVSSAYALDEHAERFVRLALEVGEYDPDYVDAYLGPEEWSTAAKENLQSEEELAESVAQLLRDLHAYSPDGTESATRHRALLRNVRAMDARIRMVLGESFSFAEEARLLYDLVLPDFNFSEFDRILQEIEKLIPGEGDLADRVDAFRTGLEIPDEARNAVVDLAIQECRRRTYEYVSLPASERFTLEYVTDQSWSGYNWYQGKNESLMQINTDFPMRISSAISLGCHEGYPGHHVWNILVENRLLSGNGWIEYSIFPLYSPVALIAEGSANYGIDLAFPGDDKVEYERDTLFPLAGLDPEQAATMEELRLLMRRLGRARVATAQLYLDGAISREEAIEQLREYGLQSRERAEQGARFIEQYRSYVVNYSLGQDIVRAYIENQGDDLQSRWEAFERMLTDLYSASEMID